jgi:membrane protein DedA with SNARE-associated domain
MDEFKRLEKTKPIMFLRKEMKMHFSHSAQVHILYALAGLIIASPLPDEAGIIMLAGLTHIKPKIMIAISLIFNALGILILCLI